MKTRFGKIAGAMVWLTALLAVTFTAGLHVSATRAAAPTALPQMMSSALLADTVQVDWNHIPFSTTATNPVTGWYHVYTGQMYDKTNNALAAAPTWTDCVTSISIDDKAGLYEDTPESTMPSGWYIWRLWDSASPAYTDTESKAKLIYWSKERAIITRIADL